MRPCAHFTEKCAYFRKLTVLQKQIDSGAAKEICSFASSPYISSFLLKAVQGEACMQGRHCHAELPPILVESSEKFLLTALWMLYAGWGLCANGVV